MSPNTQQLSGHSPHCPYIKLIIQANGYPAMGYFWTFCSSNQPTLNTLYYSSKRKKARQDDDGSHFIQLMVWHLRDPTSAVV